MGRPQLLVLCLIAVGIYSLGVDGPFILDDLVNLSPITRLESGEVSPAVVILGNTSGILGRSVSMATFVLDYMLHGFDPFWFKITNIFVHLCCGTLLYIFLILVLRGSSYNNSAEEIALFATAAWLLSPLLSSTVLYVIQRMAMLSTFFSLAAFVAYLKLRERLIGGQGLVWWGGLLALFTLLAVLSKENGVLIPLLLVVIEYFFCPPPSDIAMVKKRNRIFFFLVFFPVIAGMGLLLAYHDRFLDYSSRSFSLEQRLLTEPRIVWNYVGNLLMPASASFGLFHDDINISTGLLTPYSTLLAIIAWSGVLALIVCAYRHPRWRLIGGAVLFFLVGHAMESTVFPLELYFEHRNYLPGIGIYFCLGLLVAKAVQSGGISLVAARAAGVAYLFVFAIALSQRAMMWTSYDLLIYSSYKSHPLSSRTNVEAALRDAFSGKPSEAIAKIARIKELNPDDSLGANIQLLYTYCLYDAKGIHDEIRQLAAARTSGGTYTATALAELNELYRQSKCTSIPYAKFLDALADRLGSAMASGNKKEIAKFAGMQIAILEGLNYFGMTDKTIALARQIDQVGNGGFAVDLLLAIALIDKGQLEEARRILDKQKGDNSLPAKLQAAQLRQVEQLYHDVRERGRQ